MDEEQFFKERVQHGIDFIDAAKARGEIRADLDPLLIVSLVGGPIMYSMFFSSMFPGQLYIENLIEQLVDTIMEGIQAHSKQNPV